MHLSVPKKGDTAERGDYKQRTNVLGLEKAKDGGPSFGRNKILKRHIRRWREKARD
jgi:hypothetical protein